MAAFEVEVKGADKIQRVMQKLPPQLKREMLRTMHRAAKAVERDAKKTTPVDTGRLRGRITSQVRMIGSEIVGVVGSNVVYAPYVEFGRRPGARMPPSGIIEEWARRKGIGTGLGFVIARAIGRRGIRARKFLTRAFEKNRSKIGRMLSRTLSKVIREANR